MNRLTKRCLIASLLAHAGLLAVLVISTAFRPRDLEPVVAVLELVPTDLRLTDGTTVGGGTPEPQPPPPPVKAEPEPQRREEPVQPPPQVPKNQPKSEPEKPKAKETPRTEPAKPLKTQDVDTTRKADKPKQAVKHVVQVGNQRRQDDAAEKERREREQREAREQERQRELAALNQQRQKLADRIASAASKIGKATGSTKIEMPGPGGEAYAPYATYLHAFFRQRWISPNSISKPTASVGVSIEIARDGTLLNWKLIEPSGLRELDESVRTVLKRYSKLRPLPEGTRDPSRTFTIQFVVDGDSKT